MKLNILVALSVITLLLVRFFICNRYLVKPNPDKLITSVMNFPMAEIKKRCQKDYNYSNEDIDILEKELKRYFIMAALKKSNDIPLGMYSKYVDDLWHTFILFTNDYQSFCKNTVGYFIHHNPLTTEETPEESQNLENRLKRRTLFREYIELYEKIFNEPIHPIWLLDAIEKNDLPN